MKLRYALMFMLCFVFCISSSYASESYTNKYGVSFSQKEYDFISKLYWDGYQAYMTKDDFDYVIDEKYLDEKVETIDNSIMPMSNSHQTSSKKISISKVCQDECIITSTITWFKIPTIKSYDVLGAYLDGNAYLVSTPKTHIMSDSVSVYETNNIVYDIKGFGVSFKLPNDCNNLKITQTYKLTGSGTIYSSYQHAKRNSTLAKSKNYTFSTAGYGNVFLFDKSVEDYYDAMGGVSITL